MLKRKRRLAENEEMLKRKEKELDSARRENKNKNKNNNNNNCQIAYSRSDPRSGSDKNSTKKKIINHPW